MRMGVVVLCIFLTTGCSNLTKRNTTLNLNPNSPSTNNLEPFSITIEGREEKLSQAQTDYHYVLAEAISGEGHFEEAIEEFKLTLQNQPKPLTNIRLRLAAEYMRLGQWTEAIENIEIALEQDPKSEMGRLLLGGIYTTLQMYDEAIHQYKSLLKYHPNHLDAHLYLAGLLSEKSQYKEAEEILLKTLKNPNNDKPYMAYYYLGRLYLEQNQSLIPKAIKAFQDSLRLKPDYENAMLILARVYDMKEQHKKAIALASSFQENFGPQEETAKYLLSAYLREGRNEKAINQIRNIELFDKDNLEIKTKLTLLLIKEKRFVQAAQKLEELLVIVPDADKIRFYLAIVYYELEENYLAIENFLKVPSTSSHYEESRLQLVTLYKAEGQVNKAIEAIETALNNQKGSPQLYTYYASLLNEEKGHKTAIQVLSNAVEQFPTNTSLRFFLGTLLDKSGQINSMLAQMEKILDIDPNYVPALNYLAYTYAEKETSLEKAEKLAKRALTLKPKDAYILDTLGWVLFKKGQFQQATKYLSSAHQIKPSESLIAEHLGDAYYKLKSFNKAIHVYQKAMETAADDKQIKELRNKMEKVLANRINNEIPEEPSRWPASEENSP